MRQFKISDRITNRGSRSTTLYLNELQKTSVMKTDEEFDIACKAFEGDEEARDKLVKGNLRFVFTVAKMYSNNTDTFNDIISAGNLGLVDAAKKFDPYKGFRFISYAVWHIRKEMIEYLAKNSRTIRIPANRNTVIVKAKEAQSVIYTREGREATEDELVDYVKQHLKNNSALCSKDIADVFAADKRASSLDHPLGDDGSSQATLLDILDTSDGSENRKDDKENQHHVLELLMRGLNEREKEVVTRHWSLGTEKVGESFKNMALEFGIAPESVRGINTRALKKMKIRAKRLNIDLSSIF